MIRPPLARFAKRLRREIGAERVLLFGSRARGNARPDSDYDVIVVAPRFSGVPRIQRPVSLYRLFDETGNHAPLDLFCLTPEEFDYASTHITLVNAVLPEAIDLLAGPAAHANQVKAAPRSRAGLERLTSDQ